MAVDIICDTTHYFMGGTDAIPKEKAQSNAGENIETTPLITPAVSIQK